MKCKKCSTPIIPGEKRCRFCGSTMIIEEENNKHRIVVTEIPYQVNKAKLIESIADLVKEKKIEGIETMEQVSILQTAGCDIAQGFYYAKPMPLDEYNDFVYHHVGAYN